jgi:mono/diheme cytochrome c family protein
MRRDQSGDHHAALLPGGWSQRVAPAFRGKPILTAEQIEDVVAYLMTLKD